MNFEISDRTLRKILEEHDYIYGKKTKIVNIKENNNIIGGGLNNSVSEIKEIFYNKNIITPIKKFENVEKIVDSDSVLNKNVSVVNKHDPGLFDKIANNNIILKTKDIDDDVTDSGIMYKKPIVKTDTQNSYVKSIKNNKSIVKIAKNNKGNVLYLSRSAVPFYFNKNKIMKKISLLTP